MKEKIPLINSQNKAVKILGYVIYAFLALTILGLFVPQDSTVAEQRDSGNPIEYDTSSAGQTGRVEYDTPKGDVIVDLPAGFYLRHKLGANGTWSISAAKTPPDCIYDDKALCPGTALDIMWGKWNDDLDSWIDIIGGDDGTWTKTASGHDAWVVTTNDANGYYAAFVNYSEDKNVFMRVAIMGIAGYDPTLHVDRREFDDLIESINIS